MNEFSGETVLVTGATGLIGSHIVDKLMSQKDVNVIALSRSEDKLRTAFSQYLDDEHFSIIAGDISDGIDLGNTVVDYIFHAAGPMEGKIIKNYPVSVINPNTIGLENCLDLLVKQKENGHPGRLIVFSSVTVYGNNSSADKTVKEDDTDVTGKLDASNSCYAQSKRISEVIAQAYKIQYDIDIVIARFSTVYGNTRFIPDTAFFEFIKKSKTGEDILVGSNIIPRRDNIYIDDAVDGVLTVALKGECGQAYNISSNGDLGNYAAVDEIAKDSASVANKLYCRTGNGTKVEYKEYQDANRKPGLKLDNCKLKSLGWDITTSLEDGIRKTLEEIMI